MKTIKHLFALVLMTTLSFSTVFATTLSVDEIIIGNTTASISVNWDNLTPQTINVKVVNANQEIVIEETVKNQTQFMKKYEVSAFQNGAYNLVITKKSCRITQPFSIRNGILSLKESDKKVTYFPVISQKDNQFDVSVFLSYSGAITVNLLDENKNKVFAQTYDNVSTLHKRYSLNNVAEGMYKVEVITGDETFYYSFVK